MKTSESVVIDGYDLLAESARLAFPDRTLCGHSLNRGTAVLPERRRKPDPQADVRAAHTSAVMPSTIDAGSPVLDLSQPTHGMFVAAPEGPYLDLYLGVAQKLIDEHHPHFEQVIATLVENGLAFRREINTDDILTFSRPIEGLHAPQELAAFVNELTAAAFPKSGAFRTFFSNSGAEAGEAAMKLAMLNAYRRFVERHGFEVLGRLMEQLGIARDPFYDADTSLPDPVWRDYPFFVFATDGAFHGRTLGVLNLTRSKKAQHLGYGKLRWVRHVPFNGRVSDFVDQLDDRPLAQILDAPGGATAVLAAGRVPSELVALFATEVFQGEGGYRLADRAWLGGVVAACRARGILFGSDEVQSFGRTGTLFATQHFEVEPDIVWTAKAAVLGLTVARVGLTECCHVGWHSNTFGSGKFFDVNLSYATLELLTRRRDPLFGDRTYLENSRIKGEYVRMRLAELSSQHGEVFPEFTGLGGMWGLSVRFRPDVVRIGWEYGLKLLGCGRPGPVATIRILLLADVLTREIDEMIDGLDRVFTAVEAQHDL
ncbi:MAG: aminotransferase class III-fold pyridoxal phosphate-dependent enzyme [Planctomycetes bacterium]|nr:aminotransferase class III-fold pyridoxal phosphate-dependent enzyme [Planctomycetota bacterium]